MSKRRITVDNKPYIWSLDNDDAYSSDKWIVITLAGTSWSRLYVDPYPWAFEIRPASIRDAILNARLLGWHPEENTGDMKISFAEGKFKKIEK